MTYHDDIYQLACRIVEERTGDCVTELMNHLDTHILFLDALRIIGCCKTVASEEMAKDDLAALLHDAAMDIARREYRFREAA